MEPAAYRGCGSPVEISAHVITDRAGWEPSPTAGETRGTFPYAVICALIKGVVLIGEAALDEAVRSYYIFGAFGDLHHYRTFHSFSEQFAAVFIYARDLAGRMIGICGAASGAIQLCPTVLTFIS